MRIREASAGVPIMRAASRATAPSARRGSSRGAISVADAVSVGADAGSQPSIVARATVIDGRVPHSLLLEIFTDEGIGTMVLADSATGDSAISEPVS